MRAGTGCVQWRDDPVQITHVGVSAGPSAEGGSLANDTYAQVLKQLEIKFGVAWLHAHHGAPKLADGTGLWPVDHWTPIAFSCP